MNYLGEYLLFWRQKTHYAMVFPEPALQSIKKRYINTRQLRTQEDLVDLSARIQSVDILDVRDVLGDDYLIAACTYPILYHAVIQIS